MDIKIQGHKNILDLNLSITNNKLNTDYLEVERLQFLKR